nr:MAG TPA: hypothetical protein [Caudoviricetes sp.]
MRAENRTRTKYLKTKIKDKMKRDSMLEIP